jgi:hypothetical protein
MTRQPVKISPEKEIVILQFWAQAIDIIRSFSAEEIQSVKGLAQALHAARELPDAIGWGEEHTVRSRVSGNMRSKSQKGRAT